MIRTIFNFMKRKAWLIVIVIAVVFLMFNMIGRHEANAWPWNLGDFTVVNTIAQEEANASSSLDFYELGRKDGVEWAVECASKEVIAGHPTDIECVDFFMARQKLVADHEDYEKMIRDYDSN